jgi:hypothetical protein
MAELGYCDRCKENSVKVKIQKNKNGIILRLWICINKGHGLILSQKLK